MEKTDNELIAEFMGEIDLTRVVNDKLEPYTASYNIWATLMPVVEKICDLGYNVYIRTNRTQIYDRIHKIDSIQPGYSILEVTYHAVIDFVKLYNSELSTKQ